MKTQNILVWLCVCVAVIATVAIAAEETKPAPREQRVQQPVPGRGPIAPAGERGRGPAGQQAAPADRGEAMRQAMTQRTQIHRQEIEKLEAIVKIAEEEKAAKTVEALKALIAEKNKEFKDRVEQAEKRRQEMQKRMQERTPEQGPAQPGTAAPAGDEIRPEGERTRPSRAGKQRPTEQQTTE